MVVGYGREAWIRVPARKWMTGSVLRPALQHVDEAAQPGIGLVAVDDPMVDGQRDIGQGADLNRVDAVDLAHDHALLQLADAEDRRLRLVDDDRRREQRARDAV